MPGPDRRIRQDGLEKMLDYLIEQHYGSQISAEEKKAAIQSVAKEVMESRNNKPLEPEDITQSFLFKLSTALVATVGRNKTAYTMTQADADLIVTFQKPTFKPTPEQLKKHTELKNQFKETAQNMVEQFMIKEFAKPNLPTPKMTRDPTLEKVLNEEEKSFAKKQADVMTEEVFNDPSFSNLFGLMSPNSPIPVPVYVFFGHAGLSKMSPTYEYSSAPLDSSTRASDTAQGDPMGLNFDTDHRLEAMGDPEPALSIAAHRPAPTR